MPISCSIPQMVIPMSDNRMIHPYRQPNQHLCKWNWMERQETPEMTHTHQTAYYIYIKNTRESSFSFVRNRNGKSHEKRVLTAVVLLLVVGCWRSHCHCPECYSMDIVCLWCAWLCVCVCLLSHCYCEKEECWYTNSLQYTHVTCSRLFIIPYRFAWADCVTGTDRQTDRRW